MTYSPKDVFVAMRKNVRKSHRHVDAKMEIFGRREIWQDWDILANRQWTANRIADNKTENNTVFVHVDFIDCDHARGKWLHEIPASVMAYEKLYDRTMMDAEGQTWVSIMTPEEAAAFDY